MRWVLLIFLLMLKLGLTKSESWPLLTVNHWLMLIHLSKRSFMKGWVLMGWEYLKKCIFKKCPNLTRFVFYLLEHFFLLREVMIWLFFTLLYFYGIYLYCFINFITLYIIELCFIIVHIFFIVVLKNIYLYFFCRFTIGSTSNAYGKHMATCLVPPTTLYNVLLLVRDPFLYFK